MKISVIKIAPYLVGVEKSVYEEYEPIVLQQFSPQLKQDAEKYISDNVDRTALKNVDLIITSAEVRAIQTAEIIVKQLGKEIPIFQTKNLNEVKFSLHKLLTKEEFETHGDAMVRQRFISAFLKNDLAEPAEEIKGRMDKLIFDVTALSRKNKILCVSHSFFMKILCAYSKVKNLFSNPELLQKHIDPTKVLFECCELLEIDLETFSKHHGEIVA